MFSMRLWSSPLINPICIQTDHVCCLCSSLTLHRPSDLWHPISCNMPTNGDLIGEEQTHDILLRKRWKRMQYCLTHIQALVQLIQHSSRKTFRICREVHDGYCKAPTAVTLTVSNNCTRTGVMVRYDSLSEPKAWAQGQPSTTTLCGETFARGC